MQAWAIIVGINLYPQTTGQDPLKGAVADACDFAEWALDPAGGGVAHKRLFFWAFPWPNPAEQGRLLRKFLKAGVNKKAGVNAWELSTGNTGPPDQNRGPFAQEIVDTAELAGREAFEALAEAEEDDDAETRRIYVYLAGHGVTAQEKYHPVDQTCYLAHNFKKKKSNTVQGLIACESFRNSLLTDRFHEAILFLDCCRVTASSLPDKAIPICDTANVPLSAVWGRGHAAAKGAVAYETATKPVRGAFSKTLMDGLRGHRGAGNVLDMDELRTFVTNNISAVAPQLQQPLVDYDPPSPPGPVIVKGPPTIALPAPPMNKPGPLVHVGGLPAGTQLRLLDSKFVPVPGMPQFGIAGGDFAIPSLPEGLYVLEVVGEPGKYTLFRQPLMVEIDAPGKS